MIIKALVQNLRHGGLRTGAGDPVDRWPQLLQRFAAVDGGADVALFQEACDWDRFGERQLRRAAADLGMQALPLAPSYSGSTAHGDITHFITESVVSLS